MNCASFRVLPANLRATSESDPVNQGLSGRWSLQGNQIRLRLKLLLVRTGG